MSPLTVAFQSIGVSEIPGVKTDPRIAKMYKAVGHSEPLDDSKVSWCAAFVGYCLKEAGCKHLNTLVARDYLNYGHSVPFDQAQPGDFFVFWRESPNSWKGHVGFIQSINLKEEIVQTIEGNASNKVSTMYYNIPSFKSRLLSIQRPEQLPKIKIASTETVVASVIASAVVAGAGIQNSSPVWLWIGAIPVAGIIAWWLIQKGLNLWK